MAKIFAVLLLSFVLLAPAPASAAGFRVNVAVSRQDDGTTTGELWYNDRVVWRLRIAGDDAQPVSYPTGTKTTVIVPDVESGLFLLKVYNQ